MKIYEILYYPNTSKYDKTSNTGGVIYGFVNTFIKLKLEAGGYPQGLTDDDADKDQYVASTEEHEGIVLDKENVAFNSGVRTFSKLCLNSLWGKFCERYDDRIEKKIVKDTKQFLELLCGSKYNISDTIFYDNETCLMFCSRKDGCQEPGNVFVNIYLHASFV